MIADWKKQTTVVIPAYNEEGSIGVVIERLTKQYGNEIELLVVNDSSSDNTEAIASSLGAKVVSHTFNRGNGASVKTGIITAQTPYIIVLDADGQHPIEAIEPMIQMLEKYDMVIGSRQKGSQASLGRAIANGIYNTLASTLSGFQIEDLTSGMRAFKREIMLEFLPLLPNGFSLPTTSTLSFIRAGYHVGFFPILASQRSGKSHIRILRDGMNFFLIIIRTISIFDPIRVFLPMSAFLFLLSFISSIEGTIRKGHLYLPNSAVSFSVTAVVIFAIGLLAEMLASLRTEQIERQRLTRILSKNTHAKNEKIETGIKT